MLPHRLLKVLTLGLYSRGDDDDDDHDEGEEEGGEDIDISDEKDESSNNIVDRSGNVEDNNHKDNNEESDSQQQQQQHEEEEGEGEGEGEVVGDYRRLDEPETMGDSCSKIPMEGSATTTTTTTTKTKTTRTTTAGGGKKREKGRDHHTTRGGGGGGVGNHDSHDNDDDMDIDDPPARNTRQNHHNRTMQTPMPTIAQLPPGPANTTTSPSSSPTVVGSKRSREGKFSSLRRSILRVGSRVDRGRGGFGLADSNNSGIPNSPRARASTYSHVHDAVMYNLSEAETSKHDQTVPMGVIGLKNLGNTCFLNSSLQCLSATIPLTDYFLGYDYRSEINRDNFLGTGGKLVTAYADLMKQMWLGSKSVVEPSIFKRQLGTFAPQFSGFHQHDAQELLALLLDGIHEDLNRVKQRPYVEDRDCDGTNDEDDAIENWKNYLRRNKSLIVDMFQGQLRNTCKCLKCGHINIRFEPFMYLSLPISNTCRSLDDCMDLYLKEETLTGADQYYCEKCKEHVDGTKKQDLWMLPPVLIVHLKRFKYNDYGKVGSKNEASIRYPIVHWDLKTRVKSTRGVYPLYDLYAVSNHMGGLGAGHYTAHALNRFDDTWYEFNDSSYRSVDQSIHQRLFKSSYVLFYNRSEGDTSMPLNERSPLIRRQSVSRPDLWPHSQVDDPRQVRNFARVSRRAHEPILPNLLSSSTSSSRRKDSAEPGTANSSTTGPAGAGVDILTSITEGGGTAADAETATTTTPSTPTRTMPDPPSGRTPDPPSQRDFDPTGKSETLPNAVKSMAAVAAPGRVDKLGPNKHKPRKMKRSTRPTQI